MEFITLPKTKVTAEDLPDDIKMEILQQTAERKRDMEREQRQLRQEIDNLVGRQTIALEEYTREAQLAQLGFGFDEGLEQARREFNFLTRQLNVLQQSVTPETPIILGEQAQKLIRLQQQLARDQQMNINRRN